MLRTRVIPCLLLRNGALVKTIRFRDPKYVGDPVNAVRIYNEKEVDELVILDISATPEGRAPAFDLITRIASECFMPLAYGGGVRSMTQIRQLLYSGIEKVCINTAAREDPDLIRSAAETVGSQSIVGSIDVKRSFLGRYEVYTHGGRKGTGREPVEYAQWLESLGVGEILLTSIDRDGTMSGYDVELIRRVTRAVNVPVVACGGAGRVEHFASAVREGGASAVAAGSMVVYYGRHRAVLINFPAREELTRVVP